MIQVESRLRVADTTKRLLEDTVKAYQRSLELTQNRYNSGVAARVDVVQAEVQLKSAQAQLIDVGIERAQLEHAIALQLGEVPANFALAPSDLKIAMPQVPLALPSELLERRPDIAAAERTIQAANAQIGVAKAAMFPTFTLTGFGGGESTNLANALISKSSIWSVGLGAAMPVLDFGRYRGLTDAAIARQHQAAALYQESVETAFREVADALSTVRITSSAERDYQMSVDAARRALRLSRKRYDAGYSPYLEVLDAQRQANLSEIVALRNRQALLSATVDLMKALGGGWTPEQVVSKQ